MSEQLGMGVLINYLRGNEGTVNAITAAKGKTIAVVSMNDGLKLEFTDGSSLYLWDDGQSCCEHRYMTSDDLGTFPYYSGAEFLGPELRDAPSIEEEFDAHDCMFLDIKTSKGVFTCVTHNEHNGYYGGFSLRAEFTAGEEA